MVACEGHISKPPCLGKQVGEDFRPTLDAEIRLLEGVQAFKELFSYIYETVGHNKQGRVALNILDIWLRFVRDIYIYCLNTSEAVLSLGPLLFLSVRRIFLERVFKINHRIRAPRVHPRRRMISKHFQARLNC